MKIFKKKGILSKAIERDAKNMKKILEDIKTNTYERFYLFYGEEKYMMTGGVSKNKGLVKTLEEKLGTKLVISEKAQLCGALGAALFAADMA